MIFVLVQSVKATGFPFVNGQVAGRVRDCCSGGSAVPWQVLSSFCFLLNLTTSPAHLLGFTQSGTDLGGIKTESLSEQTFSMELEIFLRK